MQYSSIGDEQHDDNSETGGKTDEVSSVVVDADVVSAAENVVDSAADDMFEEFVDGNDNADTVDA